MKIYQLPSYDIVVKTVGIATRLEVDNNEKTS